jgi:hypothetical protein
LTLFRRNEFDVTNRINTTDPACVKLEIGRIYRSIYPRATAGGVIDRAIDDLAALYRGENPAFEKCDTAYHDLQHVLEVSLAMARLLDGYERTRGEAPAFGERLYTRTHVSRGGRFLKEYLPTLGLAEFAAVAALVLHFTGYERPVAEIRLGEPLHRLLGSLLGSADIIAQMSDRCYLEKCHDRLYPEFVEGGIAYRVTDAGVETLFASAEDLIRKTPGFFENASRRLHQDLGGTHRYAQAHFGGTNLYWDALRQNVQFAQALREGSPVLLRRVPPVTIN